MNQQLEKPPQPPRSPAVRRFVDDDEEDGRLSARFRWVFIAGAVLIFVGGGAYLATRGPKSASTFKAPERPVLKIQLPPLPPPPPPPPPKIQPPPPKDAPKMIEQEPVAREEAKPEPKPEEPPPTLGTGIKGDGPPDGFGLSGSGSDGRLGGSGGRGGGGGGSRWGWYAGQVQSKINQALRENRRTRSAVLQPIKVRIWADGTTGRVTRAQLVDSTGNAALDAALRDEVLTGLQLREPPPAGMPNPIVLRLSARRGH